MSEPNYKELLETYRNDATNNAKPIEVQDAELNKAVAVQKERQEIEYGRRDNLYTALLQSYINIYSSKEKHKKVFKVIFFSVIMVIFFLVIAGCVFCLCVITLNKSYDAAGVALAITSIGGIVSAIIVIPQIIAKHLFPANEETFMLDMVKSMQNNDAGIRDNIYAREKRDDSK